MEHETDTLDVHFNALIMLATLRGAMIETGASDDELASVQSMERAEERAVHDIIRGDGADSVYAIN